MVGVLVGVIDGVLDIVGVTDGVTDIVGVTDCEGGGGGSLIPT